VAVQFLKRERWDAQNIQKKDGASVAECSISIRDKVMPSRI
jgi:hypothetical protein